MLMTHFVPRYNVTLNTLCVYAVSLYIYNFQKNVDILRPVLYNKFCVLAMGRQCVM